METAGIEPTTFRLRGGGSDLLSYISEGNVHDRGSKR